MLFFGQHKVFEDLRCYFYTLNGLAISSFFRRCLLDSCARNSWEDGWKRMISRDQRKSMTRWLKTWVFILQIHQVVGDVRTVEVHSCKPWVTNLLTVPHTLGVLTASMTVLRYLNTLMSLKGAGATFKLNIQFLFSCIFFAAKYTSILTHLQHYRVGIFAWRKYQVCKVYGRSAMTGTNLRRLWRLILIYFNPSG